MKSKRALYVLLMLSVLATGCRKKVEPESEAPVNQPPEAMVSDSTPPEQVSKPAAESPGLLQESAASEQPEEAPDETEYMAVFMEGKKVGYAVQSRTVAESKVTTTAIVSMTISRASIPISITMTETSVETLEGEPLEFETIQDMAVMRMQVKGSVEPNGTVNVVTTSMGTEQKSTMEWPEGALMAEGLRLLTEARGLKEGVKYTARVFSPEAMQAFDAEISVGSRENVDLLGRVLPLTKVTTALNIPGAGEIVSTGYVDDEMRTLKNVMPVAGMKIEMVSCTKEFALGENDVFEVVEKMFVASPEPLSDLGGVSSIKYTLKPKEGGELTIPAYDNQQVKPLDDGTLVVTVAPVKFPSGAGFPYTGTDEAALEAMKPARFVQSDRREIIELASRAVGSTKDAGEAAKKIEAFVADYVDNRSLSVGYASAAEVAESRQGDCSEFAVLTAALCRAVGIPAQVVTGVAYVDDFEGFKGFGGHAWVQAYVGGRWVGLDAAFKGSNRGGYDAGHIALAAGNGDPEGFFDLITTLGRFTIEKVEVSR